MAWQTRVSLPDTRKLDFISKVNRRPYSISVSLPWEPPPEQGYRVLYVLDGYAYFASAVAAARLNSHGNGIVVVGVGYPDTPAFARRVLSRHPSFPEGFAGPVATMTAYGIARLYDLTLPASDEVLADFVFNPEPKAGDVGGLDDFLTMIETEVKTRVAELVPIDPANQAIFGHSIGGLAVLHALFTRPNAYRTFVAASPSIWWSRRAVLAGEAAFSAAVAAGEASPRVLITMGDGESEPPKIPPPGVDPAKIEALVKEARMVENGRELTARLQALSGKAPYEVQDYAVFEHQNHTLSPWPALARALGFAFPEPG